MTEAASVRAHDCADCSHVQARQADVDTLTEAARILAEIGSLLADARARRQLNRQVTAQQIGCSAAAVSHLADGLTIRDIGAAIKTLGWLAADQPTSG